MIITVRASHWRAMQLHVADEFPLEACGILAGQDGFSTAVFPARNVYQSPVRYQIHPQDQIRAFYELERNGWDVLAVYHSHPDGPPSPSPTDVAEANVLDTTHLIWSLRPHGWVCHAFSINYGKIIPVELHRRG